MVDHLRCARNWEFKAAQYDSLIFKQITIKRQEHFKALAGEARRKAEWHRKCHEKAEKKAK